MSPLGDGESYPGPFCSLCSFLFVKLNLMVSEKRVLSPFFTIAGYSNRNALTIFNHMNTRAERDKITTK